MSDHCSNVIPTEKLRLAAWLVAAGFAACGSTPQARAQDASATPAANVATPAPAVDGYKDTPMLPGGKWHVHDPERPQPPVVTPGTFSTPEVPGKAPSDAVVLFDGTNLSQWTDDHGQPSEWKVENGVVFSGKGMLGTKEKFGNIQLHVEFAEPTPPSGKGQGRGNSGVFLMGKYEFQVLDSYENPTYPDGQAAALYGQRPPQVNASRPPGEWQVYDIVFTVPIFNKDGSLEQPAYITAFHNGVLVQNHVSYLGPTGHRILAHYSPADAQATGPIKLQDHHNPVRFRNIWVRPIPPQQLD